MLRIETLKRQFPHFPGDIHLAVPQESNLPEREQHFLIYIPWNENYLRLVPEEFRQFFQEILPFLSARTTDVHTAVCLQYLDEFIQQASEQGKKVNRKVLAYALMLHDAGWSQMAEEEIATSLGVTGLALNESAMGSKEKHALLGEKIARQILTRKQDELAVSDEEIDLICRAIRYHDKPEAVVGQGNAMPVEVQLLVDLDHIWSFTRFNFWQDTLRKGVDPANYLANLAQDLDKYFVTDIGKSKAHELLLERRKEVEKNVFQNAHR